ncbi:hypothetical protein HOY80DRAFT_1066923 [Tuber brumale]|nr:hypothetical protein HOY80DRAFT_1066923 [Tuber brumale]
MIRIRGDSAGGGSRWEKKGGGIDIRKGAISGQRAGMGLLAAAEEEWKAEYKHPWSKSPTKDGQSGVRQSTNFDLPSHNSMEISSDTEADTHDLHRAQRMVMIFSPITSTPETQRVVRTILHGEYESIVKEVEEGTKRVQKDLVATDLGGEASIPRSGQSGRFWEMAIL